MMEEPGDVLGIEGGGTKTTWVRVARDGRVVARGETGPGNTLLLDDATLEARLVAIASAAGRDVAAVCGAFAGCAQPAEKKRVEAGLRLAWPRVAAVRVMEDTRSILAAAFGDGPGIAVIAGTGSNVAGQKSLDAPLEKAGGWGHLFADRGSAYDLARRGMEAVFARWDETKTVTALGRAYLKAARLRSLEELVPFLLRDLSKTTVAGYARCVFEAAAQGDNEARAVLAEAAEALARKVAGVARRLQLKPVRVALTGGLFENQPGYQKLFARAVRRLVPGARISFCEMPGAIGAARAAERLRKKIGTKSATAKTAALPETGLKPIAEPARLAAFSAASTEQRNPRSRGLDRRTIPQLVDLFIREERHVERALAAQRGPIARAAALIARRLQAGGRLDLRRRRDERAARRGRCERDAADLQRAAGADPGDHGRRAGGGFQEPGGCGGCARYRGGRTARAEAFKEGRGLRHRGERADAVCARGAGGGASARRGCDPALLQSQPEAARARRCGDRSADGTGAGHRLDAAEGGHGDEACVEHAEHDRDGETGGASPTI